MKKENESRYMDPEGAHALANAVIIKAVKDYRRTGKRLVNFLKGGVVSVNSIVLAYEHDMQKIENFLLSPYCGVLSQADGEVIVHGLHQEIVQTAKDCNMKPWFLRC